MTNEESNDDLSVRVAWLHYVGGHTQERIADRLGVSKPRVNRLIAAAHRTGRIRVFVEGAPESCLALGERIKEHFGIRHCHIVPSDPMVSATDQATVAVAGAAVLHRFLESRPEAMIGVGHGRTLARLVDSLPRLSRPKARFVSLLGSLTRKASANPFDMVYRLTERTGGEGYVLPIPLVVDNEADGKVLLSQSGVRHILAMASETDLALVGVGDLGEHGYWSITGILNEAERRDLRERGAVGNILGRFLDAEGREIKAPVSRRLLSVGLDNIQSEIVAVGGGPNKVAILKACLRANLVSQIITDELTGAAVLT